MNYELVVKFTQQEIAQLAVEFHKLDIACQQTEDIQGDLLIGMSLEYEIYSTFTSGLRREIHDELYTDFVPQYK